MRRTLRKKNMLKLCGALMIIFSLVMQFEITSYANGNTNIWQIKEEMKQIYSNDPEFYREMELRQMTFEELIQEKAEQVRISRQNLYFPETVVNAAPRSLSGTNFYTSVATLQQTTSYNCGPTAGVQILYGMGKENLVTGNTYQEKISTLQSAMGTTSDGTYPPNISSVLNNYMSVYSYTYYSRTSLTQDTFKTRVTGSLYNNFAPILHARTEQLSYYSGHKSGHFIVVQSLNSSTNNVQLSDCNYSNQYFGVHTVTLQEAYNSIAIDPNNNMRYLICIAS